MNPLTSTRLFNLAKSLGGVESLAELAEEMTHGVSVSLHLRRGLVTDLHF